MKSHGLGQHHPTTQISHRNFRSVKISSAPSTGSVTLIMSCWDATGWDWDRVTWFRVGTERELLPILWIWWGILSGGPLLVGSGITREAFKLKRLKKTLSKRYTNIWAGWILFFIFVFIKSQEVVLLWVSSLKFIPALLFWMCACMLCPLQATWATSVK